MIEEVIPGIHHWEQVHPGIGARVHCHYVAASGTVFDPLVPDEGIEWFDERPVERVVLSNRHHLRHAERFGERFGCPILASEPGLHEFAGGPEVQGFAFGDRLADDVVALEMDAICPDDTALLIEARPGVLLIADAIVNYGGLGFVSDSLIGDDPDAVKRRTRERAAELAERDFDALLFAHGAPMAEAGKAALLQFAVPSAPVT
jgi:glyoxylase-like metal-dependent hydrolase (beta-lactamase superfamily II)